MRLIDADWLRETMYREAFEKDTDMQRWDGGCWIRYKMFENAIEAAPTVSPKQGRWIDCKGSDGKDYRKCSECLHTQEITGLLNFCPVCGARMEEVTE